MKLQFMTEPPLNPQLMTCPHCAEDQRIGVHSYQERRYKCHACQRTFAATAGTVCGGLHYPLWVVVLVLTLLACGCPVAAIVAAFAIDERTVRAWLHKAGQHGQALQEQLVCSGQIVLGQVQADELCVTTQHGQVWIATALGVFSRLFLWGAVAPQRDRALLKRLLARVRAAASNTTQAVLLAVDGFSAYPKAIQQTFYTKLYTGRPGQPRHLPWPDLHVVQVVKQRRGRQLVGLTRRLVQGSLSRAYDIVAWSQVDYGLFNTAYVERLNATFRARMPTLVRRTRSLARTTQRLTADLFWTGVVYNFCTVHTSLATTPAVAAGLTDHVWSVEELLRRRQPPKQLHAVV